MVRRHRGRRRACRTRAPCCSRACPREGLTFYTNTRSAKGHELAAHPHAALVLLWHPMYRQIRVRGTVTPTGPEDAAAYFATRPRGSQVATRASRQSQPIGTRAELEAKVAAEESRWPDTGSPDDVPAPSTWGGYLVRPDVVELWVGQRVAAARPAGLHRTGDGGLDDPRVLAHRAPAALAWRTSKEASHAAPTVRRPAPARRRRAGHRLRHRDRPDLPPRRRPAGVRRVHPAARRPRPRAARAVLPRAPGNRCGTWLRRRAGDPDLAGQRGLGATRSAGRSPTSSGPTGRPFDLVAAVRARVPDPAGPCAGQRLRRARAATGTSCPSG